MELFSVAARNGNAKGLVKEIRQAARAGARPWSDLVSEWDAPGQKAVGNFEVQELEFRKIEEVKSEYDLIEESLFGQRFLKALGDAGFPKDFSRGVNKALQEMIDNVRQHSGAGGSSAPGIVGYQVVHHYFAFSVSDLGEGFHASLTRSPTWAHLADEGEALLAVIHKHASSRTQQGEGEGFKGLFKALADHGAIVRIRSRDAVAEVHPPTANEGRRADVSSIQHVAGAHVSVCCQIGRDTDERAHVFFSGLNH